MALKFFGRLKEGALIRGRDTFVILRMRHTCSHYRDYKSQYCLSHKYIFLYKWNNWYMAHSKINVLVNILKH